MSFLTSEQILYKALESLVGYCYHTHPYLSLLDIDVELPSPPDYWEAESAEVWASYFPWTDVPETPPRVSALFTTLFQTTESTLDVLDQSHYRPLILMLVRSSLSPKEIHSFPISCFDGKVPPISKLRIATKSILDCLLSRRTNHLLQALTKSEKATVYHDLLLLHMTYIYQTDELVNWLVIFQRKGSESMDARAGMLEWANRNPELVREAIFHCAQIVGIFQKHKANSPYEPIFALHAGLVIWCLVDTLPNDKTNTAQPFLCLDKTFQEQKYTSTITEWIRSGNPQSVRIEGIPNLACQAGKDQTLRQTAVLLKRMRCWGIARDLLSVVIEILNSERV